MGCSLEHVLEVILSSRVELCPDDVGQPAEEFECASTILHRESLPIKSLEFPYKAEVLLAM